MKSYAPYENVVAAAYPPILATTSLNDTRVLYVEPAKWVARLRATQRRRTRCAAQDRDVAPGMAGSADATTSWRERAFEYAWVIDTAGAPHTPPDGTQPGHAG